MALFFHTILCFLFSTVLSDDAAVETPEIVNGDDAWGWDYPWIASLRKGSGTSFCTGSLIQTEPPVVLTAAHCVEDLSWDADANSWLFDASPVAFYVDFGRTYPLSDRSSYITLQLDASSTIVIHPDYASGFWANNDVALIGFAYSSQVKSIAYVPSLPTHTYGSCCYDGEQFTIVGYGRVSSWGYRADQLQRTTHSFMPLTQCRNTYFELTTTMYQILCTQSETSGTCYGDSGGPVLAGADAEGSGVQLVGVTSFIYGGCSAYWPDGAMSVAYYRSWIDSEMIKISKNARLARMFSEHVYNGLFVLAWIKENPLQAGVMMVMVVALCFAVMSKYGSMCRKGKNFEVYQRIPGTTEEAELNEC